MITALGLKLAFLKPFWDGAKALLSIAIHIPLILIIGALLWTKWDKSSAVRRAVDTAVAKLVVWAELDAANARIAALEKIVAQHKAEMAGDSVAKQVHAEQLAKSNAENERLSDAIALVESQPVNSGCVVDQQLLDRLR